MYVCSINPMHPLCGALSAKMCVFGLQAIRWSHIGILTCILAAVSNSITGLCFPYYLCGTILLTLFFIVWDWCVKSSETMGPFSMVCKSRANVFSLAY